MSKVAITGNASGTGVFTLAAPNSNSDRTLTLPDEAGTVLTSASTVAASQITGALNATGSAPIYACRAWVNFDGTNASIRASGNMSSITRHSAGQYSVNMGTAMPDANYCVTLAKQNPAGTNISDIGVHNGVSGSVTTIAPTNSSFRVMLNQSLTDSAYVMCAVFR